MSEPNKWQSIATAPKDGTKILAYERIQETDKILSTAEWPAHDKIMVAWWDVTTRTKKVPVGDGLFREAEEIDFEGWIDGWDRWIPMSCNPSHWQPLPSPPPNHTQPEP